MPQGRLVATGAALALVSRLKWQQSWATTAGVAVGAITVLGLLTWVMEGKTDFASAQGTQRKPDDESQWPQ